MTGAPLSRLEDIDWARLTHAYGPADDVPKQLRDLVSPDAGTRERARWELFGNIIHHGARFEASCYAVPFLLHLAADARTPERPAVLELLACLAIGDDDAHLPGQVPVLAWREQASIPVPGLDEAACAWKEWSLRSDGAPARGAPPLTAAQRARMELAWTLAAYDAVEDGVGLFRELLRDTDPGVRAGAAYLLAWFPEHAAGSLPLLMLHARMEGDPVAAASMVVAAGLLGTRRNPVAGGLLRESLEGRDPWLRWAASVALARRDGPAAREPVTAELCRQVRTGTPEVLPGAPRMPFLDGDTRGYAALALAGLGGGQEAAEAMLQALPSVWGAQAVHLLVALFAVAFPRGRVPPGTAAEDLTGTQARVVAAVAGARNAWFMGTSLLTRTSDLVAGYGLPGTFEGFRRFAGLA